MSKALYALAAAACVAIAQPASAETTEANDVACPTSNTVRLSFERLQVGVVSVDQPTGMAAKMTRVFDTDDGGFVASIVLPGLTVRDIVFRGPPIDFYSGPVRRFNLCGGVFEVKSSWGHPYFGYWIEINLLKGAAAIL